MEHLVTNWWYDSTVSHVAPLVSKWTGQVELVGDVSLAGLLLIHLQNSGSSLTPWIEKLNGAGMFFIILSLTFVQSTLGNIECSF